MPLFISITCRATLKQEIRMRVRHWSVLGIFVAGMVCGAPIATAQNGAAQPDNAAMMQKIRDLEDRVIALEGQLRVLKEQQAPPTPQAGATPAGTTETGQAAAPSVQTQAPVAPGPSPTPAVASSETTQAGVLGGAGASAAKLLNPDISMIGDFIGVAGHN